MGWKALLFCFALIVAHLLYTVWFPSIVNGERFYLSSGDFVSPEYITAFHESRTTITEFARRPITTWLINSAESVGLPTSKAFLLVEYAGLGLSLLLLFRLAFLLTGSAAAARWSVVLFITQFWVLHAFFAQIYAYDEPWQYVFLFLMLEMWHFQRWWLFGLFLLLSLMARESSLLLVPGLLFRFFSKRPFFRISNIAPALPVVAAGFLYVGFLGYWISSSGLLEETVKYSQGERWEHYRFSFSQWDMTVDTMMSLVLSFFLPFVIIFLSKNKAESEDSWRNAFWISFVINTPIALLFTMGREARILAQPLILLSPFLGYHFMMLFKVGCQHLYNSRKQRMGMLEITQLLVLVASIYGASLIAQELYWPTDTMFFRGFQLYAYFTFVFSIFLIAFSSKAIGSWIYFVQYRWALAFVLVAVCFFAANQRGYRFYDEYDQLVKSVQTCDGKSIAIVNTHMAYLIERYFEDQGEMIIAGCFNHEDDYSKFLDQSVDTAIRCVVYGELVPLIDVPMRYELYNRFGTKAELSNINFPIIKYEVFDGLKDSKYSIVVKDENLGVKRVDEYRLNFKAKLGDIGIDTLRSVGLWVLFSEDSIPERASVVLSVSKKGQTILWKGVNLNSVPASSLRDNRAWLSAQLPSLTDTSVEVEAYVWNPDQEMLRCSDLHVDINTPWTQPLPNRNNVLGSRNLR
ncbi:MAG: hypothetical protein R2813_07005 [Flavobacteriales bacterium]